MNSFAEAVKSDVSPCDDCMHASLCRYGKLACERFKGYVQTGLIDVGLPTDPFAKLYSRLFGGSDDDEELPGLDEDEVLTSTDAQQSVHFILPMPDHTVMSDDRLDRGAFYGWRY